MNLITAVIVENAIESGAEERSLRVAKEAKKRQEMCQTLAWCLPAAQRTQQGGRPARREQGAWQFAGVSRR